MKIICLLVLILLLAITTSSSPERKRRMCGKALHLFIKKVCNSGPCEAIHEIAHTACSTAVTASWVKDKCCPSS
ncbi:hypothetical protein CAEBREN_23547 [Caenorhabditis brenneri]|uniref:Uncharacterized protein n=1 Tax=Caenorhabditis brenneri TaxID=135651 RepID=G0MJA6_CAEBE|nr:hypothetical protein CAEBREN_23547 [Caenorhabditis brenneri]